MDSILSLTNELIQSGLESDKIKSDLSAALVDLVTAPSSTSTSTLSLYSSLSTLVTSLLTPSHPSIPLLASYFTSSLFPLLAESSDPTAAEYVSNILVDVVWQVDVEIECDVGLYRAKTAGDEEMQVDGGGVGGQGDTKTKEQKAKQLREELRNRLAELVKLLTTSGVISSAACLERLDTTFLSLPALGLILPYQNFARLEIRARTALYYKQQKFNLLREESEGYSKLIVEIMSNLGPSHDPKTGKSVETETQRIKRAKVVGDSVKQLIGNFDLDPDRTLDIILDIFSDQIILHHQFFIDFLSYSPWAPRKSASESTFEGKGKGREGYHVGLEDEKGSFLIAQILGFKFVYYQQQSTTEVAPDTLYLMAALLIWHGFVKLGDLWTHLTLSDEEMTKLKATYEAQQDQLASSVGGANALAMAGALVDDDAPTKSALGTSAAEKEKVALEAAAAAAKELPNQKLGLLEALLAVGDTQHSLFILSLFPHSVPANTRVADLLLRLIKVPVSEAYTPLSLASTRAQYSPALASEKKKYVSKGSSGAGGGKKEPILTGEAFPDPNREYRFFFPEWKERILKPQEGNWEETLEMLELWLPFVNVFVSRDFELYSKICRIITDDFTHSPDADSRKPRWISLLRLHLLPGLSLLGLHAAAAYEIWAVLELLPIETRYSLYGEWKDMLYKRIPALRVPKAETEKNIKGLLRRLSTDNVKKLGKMLAKIVHTNPTISFHVVLNQVQSYDNLIVPVLDAARYLTPFGYDVMGYSLLDALCGPKAKTKDDGTSVALWLQSLATFTGILYRKWTSMQGSLPTVLQYLVNRLVAGDSKDLVILRELVSKMTGIEPFADLSDQQVLALAGGKILRSEVFSQTDISHATKRPALTALGAAKDRLTNALNKSGLAIPLLVNIALQRQSCIAIDGAHLKSLGSLFDQNHAVLFQYLEFLAAVVDPDELAAQVPTLETLVNGYGIEVPVAFDITRPKLRLAMRMQDEANAKLSDAKRKAAAAALLAAKAGTSTPASLDSLSETVSTSGEAVKVEEVKVEDVKVEEVKVEENGASSSNGDVVMSDAVVEAAVLPTSAPSSPWHTGLLDVISSVDRILPDEVREIMGAPFFVTFWQLTLHDINCPKERYDNEITRLTKLQREVNASNTLKNDEKEKFTKVVIAIASSLADEVAKHDLHRSVTFRRLTKEKSNWFPNVRTRENREALIVQILEHCIQPRAKLSLPDAVFAHQFIKRLHTMNTTPFHTLVFYEKLLTSQLGPTIFSCSENEARNYARFLYEVFSELHQWHGSEAAYKQEAANPSLQGFLRKWPRGNNHNLPPPPYPESDLTDYDKFFDILIRWQNQMVKAFRDAFESGEYMHIKNSILVLTKIAPFFPIDLKVGKSLESLVRNLIAVETREDLKILATGYKAVLSKRRKHWVESDAEAAAPAPAPATRATPTSTPAPASALTPVPSAAPSAAASPSAAPPVVTTAAPTASAPTGPKHASLPAKPNPHASSTSLRPSASRQESDSRPLAGEAPRSSASTPRPVERSSDHLDRAQERLPDRVQDHRASERPSDRHVDRHSDRASERSADPRRNDHNGSNNTSKEPPRVPSLPAGLPARPLAQSRRDEYDPKNGNGHDQRESRDNNTSSRRNDTMDPPRGPLRTDQPPSRGVSPRRGEAGRRDRSAREVDTRGERSRQRSPEGSTHSAGRRSDKGRDDKDRSRDHRDDKDDRSSGSKEKESRSREKSNTEERSSRSRHDEEKRSSRKEYEREEEYRKDSRRDSKGSSRNDELEAVSRSVQPEYESRSSSSAVPTGPKSHRPSSGSDHRSASTTEPRGDRLRPPPGAGSGGDRLRPAPAAAKSTPPHVDQDSSSKGARDGSPGFSIKGRGGVHQALQSAPQSGSRARGESSNRRGEREDESRKRGSSSLADRMDDPSSDRKRPRTHESGRDQHRGEGRKR